MLTITDMLSLNEGDKVMHLPTHTIYDFGYVSWTGRAVIYEEGCRDMQSSRAIPSESLVLLEPSEVTVNE
jgi:hypothetical protein